MRRLTIAAAAAAVSVFVVAGAPAFAQEQTADAALTGMAQLGIDTEGVMLTEEQVLQITAILSDAGLDDAEKTEQINVITGAN